MFRLQIGAIDIWMKIIICTYGLDTAMLPLDELLTKTGRGQGGRVEGGLLIGVVIDVSCMSSS